MLTAKDSPSAVQSPIVITGRALGAPRLIIFGSKDGNVRAVDDAGRLVWSFTTGGPVTGGATIGINGLVFFGSFDGYLYCCRHAFGNASLVWKKPLRGNMTTSPLLLPDGTVVAISSNGFVSAFVGADGRELWNSYVGGTYLFYSAAFDAERNTVLVPFADTVAELNARTGVQLCSFNTQDTVFVMTPSVGKNFIVFSSQSGFVYWLEKKNGMCISDPVLWPGVNYMQFTRYAQPCVVASSRFQTQALWPDDTAGIAGKYNLMRVGKPPFADATGANYESGCSVALGVSATGAAPQFSFSIGSTYRASADEAGNAPALSGLGDLYHFDALDSLTCIRNGVEMFYTPGSIQ
jgi:outer membrane protein assembly factor BamB